MTEKQDGWVKLDMEAYKRLVASAKDDKDFRKKLKELTKASGG